MDLLEFRDSFINEDVNAEAVNTHRYPIEVFIDQAADILKNDYSPLTDHSVRLLTSLSRLQIYPLLNVSLPL